MKQLTKLVHSYFEDKEIKKRQGKFLKIQMKEEKL